ncbi:MAG: glycosyltransferase [Verrucomicrobia bacterium]|nr:glycosyltransferase [Verrucomicrobiota bacterium]
MANRLLIWELTNATPGNKFVDPEASRLLGRCRAMLSPSAAIDRGIRETYRYNGPILRLPFWIEEVEEQKPEDRRQKSEVRGQGTEEPAESRKQKGPESDLPTPLSPLPSPISYLPSSLSAPPDFIFLGRRDVEKGLHELVRATAEVAKEFPGVRVLIAGQGSEETFAAIARELGVSGSIQFQFFRTREETMAVLANSRCLVLPSYHEGYPLVLLEAIRVGVPVIATSVGSIPEVFGGSKSAILVPPKNAARLAEAMRVILSESPPAHDQRRQAARELFRKLNAPGAIQSRLQTLLQQSQQLDPAVP